MPILSSLTSALLKNRNASRSCALATQIALLTLTHCATASAAPSIAWIFPAGGQRGTTVTLAVAGDNLTDLHGFFTTGTGLKAELMPAMEPLQPPLVSPKPGEKPAVPEAKRFRQFRIAIAPDAPLSRHEVRVFDATGASNPRYFHVGDQPETVEREPNDESTGQPVDMPVVVNGRIQGQTDQDTYTFRGRKGQRIVGEIYGLRSLGMIGDSWLKGYMELRDGVGKVLAASEGYYRWDPMLDVTLPADGDYTFLFRELTFRGAESAVYRLAIGSLPRSTAMFPAGGRRGATLRVSFVGANLGEQPTRTLAVPPDAALGPREERLQTPSGWTNALPFEISDLPEAQEFEPNDGRSQAMRVMPPVILNGRIERPGDVDSFRFQVKKGQKVVLEVLANRAETRLDPFLRLWDSDDNLVQENDDALDRDSRIERTFDSDGEYVLQIRDLEERGGDSFVYRLRIAPPRPDFSLVTTPDKPVILAGGTVALDVAVRRADGFDGDVAVSVDALPSGLTASAAVMRKGRDRGRITVSAASEMSIQAMALRVVGQATIDGREERRLAETTETYNIQGTAFTRELIGPIATIGGPTPVALAVEPTTLSLKAGESASLSVRLKRRPDATGEVTLKLADLPPGVTAEPVKAAPGATEATLLLRADPDAGAAAVDLVAVGETKVGESGLSVTSPLFSLAVVEVPGYVVSVEPQALTVPRSSKAETTVTVKTIRRGGFDGAIDLEWLLPATGAVLPAGRIEAGKTEAKAMFTAPADLPVGLAELRLVAKSSVSGTPRSRELAVKLTVTPPATEAKP
jgi:hypothetical protein